MKWVVEMRLGAESDVELLGKVLVLYALPLGERVERRLRGCRCTPGSGPERYADDGIGDN